MSCDLPLTNVINTGVSSQNQELYQTQFNVNSHNSHDYIVYFPLVELFHSHNNDLIILSCDFKLQIKSDVTSLAHALRSGMLQKSFYQKTKHDSFPSIIGLKSNQLHDFFKIKSENQLSLYLENLELLEFELKTEQDNDFTHSLLTQSILPETIKTRSYARCGLMGNPSDGFFGKTISILISNFWAEISLVPNVEYDNESIEIVRNNILDPYSFDSINVVQKVCRLDGYYGVSRLFLATLTKFSEYCQLNGLNLLKTGFSIYYETNIPRQVGLAGSSALVTCLLKALIKYNNLEIPKYEIANLALSIERDELGISAGHQDRVIQIYGGCVFMDFDKKLMESRGYGEYTQLDINSLPEGLWISFIANPEESGLVHNNIKERYKLGDKEVIDAMAQFGNLASSAKHAIETNDSIKLAKLMSNNFDLRRKLYGDKVIGQKNIEMVDLAIKYGQAAKFCGSGGCIIGLWKGDPEDKDRIHKTDALEIAMRKQGFVFCKIKVQKAEIYKE